MPDYSAALTSPSREAYDFDTLNGESVLCYTLLAPSVDDSNLSALRYVVSLTAVKRQIYILIAAAGILGAAIIDDVLGIVVLTIFLLSFPVPTLSIPSSIRLTRCARLPCKFQREIFPRI